MMDQQRIIALTGATGFYGRHLIPALRAAGYQVRAIIRRSANFPDGVDARVVGDFRTSIDWPGVLAGVHAVVHAAGLAHVDGILPEGEFDQVNRVPTAQIARACQTTGSRMIYISSLAAQCGSAARRTLTEEDEPRPVTAYGRSKLQAEEEIAANLSDYVVLRPCLTYGRYVGGNMRSLLKFSTFRVPPPLGMLTNRRSLLAVENLASAVKFGIKLSSPARRTFLLADRSPVTIQETIALLRQGAGLPSYVPRIPLSWLEAMARGLHKDGAWEKLSSDLVVSVDRLEAAGFKWAISASTALKSLGAIYRKTPW